MGACTQGQSLGQSVTLIYNNVDVVFYCSEVPFVYGNINLSYAWLAGPLRINGYPNQGWQPQTFDVWLYDDQFIETGKEAGVGFVDERMDPYVSGALPGFIWK